MSKLITPNAMLSYPHLHEPQAATKPGQKAKYSGALVFRPEDLATPEAKALLKKMQDALVEVAIARFGATVKVGQTMMPMVEALAAGVFKTPFSDKAVAKGYPAGSIFINVRSNEQPGLVYPFPEPGTNKPAKVKQEDIKTVFYPGAIVRATVSAFAYDNESKGVSFGLNNMQKVAEGTRLDNRTAAEDDFTADLNAAPASLDIL